MTIEGEIRRQVSSQCLMLNGTLVIFARSLTWRNVKVVDKKCSKLHSRYATKTGRCIIPTEKFIVSVA